MSPSPKQNVLIGMAVQAFNSAWLSAAGLIDLRWQQQLISAFLFVVIIIAIAVLRKCEKN